MCLHATLVMDKAQHLDILPVELISPATAAAPRWAIENRHMQPLAMLECRRSAQQDQVNTATQLWNCQPSIACRLCGF